MGLLLAYILKSALYTIAFYLLYRLLLSRDTFYRFNRHALVCMLVLSLLLPLVEFGRAAAAGEGVGDISIDLSLAAMTIVEDEATIPWSSWGLLLYLIGMIIFGLKTVVTYISLARVLHSGEKRHLSDYGMADHNRVHLLVHHDKMSPFSWMNYIMVNEEDLKSNGQSIIYHELGHIRHRHTQDLLFTEVCLILQWFNPAIWLMRRELQTVHEYQADEEVLNEGIDARQYQLLLIEKATGTRLQSITCSLHQSSIKNRITMMLKKKSNPWAKAKMLFAIPMAITGIALFSTTEANALTNEISGCKVSEIFSHEQISAPESVNPVAQPTEIAAKEEESEDSQVFMVCEKMPEYPGGEQAMLEFIRTNLKYPKECADKAIQGRVFVSFIVEKDGSISNTEVMKSAHPLLDEEAVRVIKSMPKWTPGQQRGKDIRVKYVFPVIFRLS